MKDDMVSGGKVRDHTCDRCMWQELHTRQVVGRRHFADGSVLFKPWLWAL